MIADKEIKQAISKSVDQFLLAATVFLEARGEPVEGQYAVAHVIMNRLNEPRKYGATLGSVILKPYQFSCWNISRGADIFALFYAEAESFHGALEVALNVLARNAADWTAGANHYCTEAVVAKTAWAKPEKRTCQIGRHVFYKL